MIRLVFGAIFGLLVVVTLLASVQKVPLNHVGIVTDNFGDGVQQTDREPGYHFIIPGVQTMSLWDPTAQVIHLEQVQPTGGERGFSSYSGRPGSDTRVHIRGKDQYTTHLDMTVIYRIRRDAAGKTQAWAVAKKLGSMEKLHEIVMRNSTKVIWEVMSDLSTEEFYDTDRRVKHSDKAWKVLDEALTEEGVEVLDVMVRKIDYDANFEARLLEKQLLEQDQLLQSSLAKAEKEKQVTEKIQKETEAMVKQISGEREKEVKTILAEKDKTLRQIEGDTNLYTTGILSGVRRYMTERIAEGDLLVAKARAKGEEAINAAYLQAGGDFLLGKKMIENVEFGQIEINTNQWNPFDIQETLRKILGGAPRK